MAVRPISNASADYDWPPQFTSVPTGNGSRPAQAIPRPDSWLRVDLAPIIDGGWQPPQPAHLTRTDGKALLYAGAVHTFNGEPESMKSWCAQLACLQVVQGPGWALYLDFEDTADSVVRRLLAMGATRDQLLERFDYRRVDEPLTPEAAAIFEEALACQPSLVVLDGVTEAMGLLGLDPYSNPDVAKFWALIPRRASRAGATVVLLDHVVKSTEARGRWAIGAQHKLAAVDGAAFTFTTLRPFGAGRTGEARIELAKDRPGQLRGYTAGHTVAHLKLVSDPDGGVSATVEAPAEHGDDFRPVTLMERVSRYVELHPGVSKHTVETAVNGRNEWKRVALDLLAAEGYVDVVRGPRAAMLVSSLKPFRADENEQL